jgi:signal transduction histidine kinase
MRLTPCRRIVMLGVVLSVVVFTFGYRVAGFIDRLRGTGRVCGSSLPGFHTLCEWGIGTAVLQAVAVVILLAVLLLPLQALAGWCLHPVLALIAPIAQVGPQNLGYRIRARGTRDELRSLTDAIDDMMDRVAEGYEGQRRFAANASHELRTPLAVQRTLIEVSMASSLNADQIELVTRQLLITNERNEQLIEGLLVLSESDQGLIARTPQRLDDIATTVVADHHELAASARVTLHTDLTERIVPGERVLLERLVTNLVQNAIKYNRPGGEVQVIVGVTPALVVTNTGPEIPAEAIAGLFEPFRRLATDRINHGGGAGLGLTIARSITQAHDGRIRAQPQARDGMRVEVELPTA